MIVEFKSMWLQVSTFVTDTPSNVKEIQARSGLPPTKVVAGIVFARSNGLVTETTRRGNRGRRVSYYARLNGVSNDR